MATSRCWAALPCSSCAEIPRVDWVLSCKAKRYSRKFEWQRNFSFPCKISAQAIEHSDLQKRTTIHPFFVSNDGSMTNLCSYKAEDPETKIWCRRCHWHIAPAVVSIPLVKGVVRIWNFYPARYSNSVAVTRPPLALCLELVCNCYVRRSARNGRKLC